MRLLAILLVLAWPAWAQTFPGAAWDRAAPADPAAMDEARSFAGRIGTAGLVVVQHGRVVGELGAVAARFELHSIRKSLLSALIGIAVGRGELSLDATLGQLGIDDVPPSLSAGEKGATLRQLLQSRSGVYHVALYETEGERRLRPERGSHPPGSFWYYNNWDFNVLGTIYERAAGRPVFAAMADAIAGPVGMQDYRPQDGRYVTGPESVFPAYPLRMSARDLARFGLLFLHRGAWNGRQVVPAAWVDESTAPASLTAMPSGYGLMWWTGFNGGGVPRMGLPPGAFWADGARGQVLVVDPADDLVIAHLADVRPVRRRDLGHLVWLIRRAAGAAEPGPDPALFRR